MDLVHAVGAGLDVHKETVVACVRRVEGGRVRQEVRTFRTETSQLLALADWLTDERVTPVAMESTGVYWKPLRDLFEGVFELLPCNAEHVKAVPGRKTDVTDAQWLAQLPAHGLLKPRFVPDKPVRQLRDLTRQRVQLVRHKVQVANRIQETREDASVKLASVASDVLGASGRDMLRAIVSGERDPVVLADLARQRLRAKIPPLQEALLGEIEDHHRFLLGVRLEQVEFVEGQIAKLTARIGEVLPPPFSAAVERRQTTPGIERRAAEGIAAELGADLRTFATAGHLASWVGGGRATTRARASGRAGGRRRGTCGCGRCGCSAHGRRAGARGRTCRRCSRGWPPVGGRSRALVAVGHRLLAVIFRVLKHGETYRELGADSLDRATDRERLKAKLVKRLEKLGVKVTVEDAQPVA